MSGRRVPGRLVLPALLLVGVVLGCSGLLQRPTPDKVRYVLDPGVPPAAADAARSGVLRVDRVRVSPLFEQKSFVIRTGEDRWTSDFYHEFFAPPGALVRQALVRWIEAASLFSAVVRDPVLRPDWLLAVEVESLYADRHAEDAPQAVLALRARLVDTRGGEDRLVWARRYEEREPVSADSAEALVSAWNRGLARIFGAMTGDLRAAVAPSAPPAAGGAAIDDPAGFADDPAGFAYDPAGFAEDPAGFAPRGLR